MSDYIETIQALEERVRNAPDEAARQQEERRAADYARACEAANSAVADARNRGETVRAVLEKVWSTVFDREYGR